MLVYLVLLGLPVLVLVFVLIAAWAENTLVGGSDDHHY